MTEFEKNLVHATEYLKGKNQEVICFYVYDPNNAFFKSKSTDRYEVNIYSCSCCDQCQAYKLGCCLLKNGLWGERCPFGNRHRIEGPTKKAKSGFNFVMKAKEQFKYSSVDREVKGKSLESVQCTCKIGDGSYIYINLPHLYNYVNPITEALGMTSEYVIPAENFTEKAVRTLLNFRPQALFGGEIETYQKKEVPKFVRDLKRNFRPLYDACVVGTPYEVYGNNIDYKGKKAFLKTLKPGDVVLDHKVWHWDGKKLTIQGKVLMSWALDDEVVSISPHDRTVVEICDNDTVDEIKTAFKNI